MRSASSEVDGGDTAKLAINDLEIFGKNGLGS
jgi:hypothetical protein